MPYSRGSANRVFAYALLASLALHAFLLAFEWPQLRDALKQPVDALAPIIARLVEPAPPAAAPPPAPAPPPVAEAPAPPPKPKPRPALKPAPFKAEAAKPVEPPPERRLESLPAPAPAPSPSPAPAPSPAPVAKAAPQPASPATAPAVPDVASLIEQYRAALLQEARRHKGYPMAAVDNGWEGDVVVRMAIAPDGSIAALSVQSSSGYAVLDRQALEMFRRARPQVPVPEALRGKAFSLELRAVFNLKDHASG